MQRINSQRGAALTEYALGLLLLVVVLIPIMIALTSAATLRTNESLGTVKKVAPCSDRLAQLGHDYGLPRSVDEASNPQLTADVCN